MADVAPFPTEEFPDMYRRDLVSLLGHFSMNTSTFIGLNVHSCLPEGRLWAAGIGSGDEPGEVVRAALHRHRNDAHACICFCEGCTTIRDLDTMVD